jgi:glycosyltransferase involved in cell wall biosynthesis
MRICLVYDCLYPYTIGGAERWYRNLAERLAAAGHEVTFLTRRQWGRDAAPDVPGVRVIAVSPPAELYAGGRRRARPPLRFGLGVWWHLRRHGSRYDLVHTASFPYFSLLGAAAARKRTDFRLVVDWHEVWTPGYWREYLGRIGGALGWRIQRACIGVRQRAFCFSRLHEQRLHEEGLAAELTRLEGQYTGVPEATDPRPARAVVVFAGRHIPEKRAPALVPAIAEARRRLPELRGEIYGDGPERADVLQTIARSGLQDAISAPGFVSAGVLENAIATALCLVLPSRREGYGLVVIEAASRGVPVVVVAGPDNAAVELVDDGTNGVVAQSAEPHELADAILRIEAAGPQLRASTADWFRRNAERLSFDSSFERVLEVYGES